MLACYMNQRLELAVLGLASLLLVSSARAQELPQNLPTEEQPATATRITRAPSPILSENTAADFHVLSDGPPAS